MHNIDVMCLAETWHDTDSVAFRRLRFVGYQVVDRPRPRPPSELPTMSTNHGGVAVVSVSGVRMLSIALGVDPILFELLCARVLSGSFSAIVVLIYRPGSEAITTTFLVDLAETLDRVVAYNDPVYIVGDLNVRLDRDDDINNKQLLELLDVYVFTVQVSDPTHARGGLLDVVATRHDDAPLAVTVCDAGLSDHHLLL